MLPTLNGQPIRVELRDTLGPHWAATSIPQRLVLLDREVLAIPGEFERILIHELFHFAWVRLSNASRREWEVLLAEERSAGELGWSAEWRKQKLTPADRRGRSPKWRRYVRESFCDSAAWAYSGLQRHDEFTLPARLRRVRKLWLLKKFATSGIAI